MPTTQVPFFTISQVAQRLQLSVKTVRRLIQKGDLVAHRFGNQLRISEADLHTYERVNRNAWLGK